MEKIAADQARDWQRRRIVSSDYPLLREELFGTPVLSARSDDDDDGGYFVRGGASRIIPAEDAIGLIREAANHYPHPAGGLLLDAALAALVPLIDLWSVDGVSKHGVDYEDVDDIIKKILEDPDALLG